MAAGANHLPDAPEGKLALPVWNDELYFGSVGQMVRAGCHRFVIPRASLLGIEFSFDVGEGKLGAVPNFIGGATL